MADGKVTTATPVFCVNIAAASLSLHHIFFRCGSYNIVDATVTKKKDFKRDSRAAYQLIRRSRKGG